MTKLIFLQVVTVAAFGFSGGCVDPGGTFDDFQERVVDAASRPDARSIDEIPDVTGEFYMGLRPGPTPSLPFRFLATTVLHQDASGATLDLSMLSLDRETFEPVGAPNAVEGVVVSDSGEFTAVFIDVVIPARANPVSGQELTADVTLIGQLRTEDLYCGDAEGMVNSPFTLSLDGSTFAAIRVAPGTTGMDLPELVGECPASIDDPDAGVPDAGPADAGPADASPADAAASDA